MSKHTPAPWHVKHRKDWNHFEICHTEKRGTLKSRPEVATAWKVEPGKLKIASISDSPNPTVPQSEGLMEAKANAHLISAAPELLKACEGFIAWARENAPAGSMGSAYSDIVLAVDKAKGGK